MKQHEPELEKLNKEVIKLGKVKENILEIKTNRDRTPRR